MRHRMVAPIISVKHYVNIENTPVASAGIRIIEIVDAVAQEAIVNTEDVTEGSLVKAVFIEMWIKSDATAGNGAKFQFSLEKLIGGAASNTFAGMNTMAAYLNKKNVLFYSQGVLGDLTTQAVPVVRQWFKIPKGKQRMGLDDKIQVSITSSGASIDTCGFATYKEYK